MNLVKSMKHDRSIVFTENRTFALRSKESGEMEWYFNSREGDIGPYRSEELAKTKLIRHIERCQHRNLDGGRRFELARTKKAVT